MLRNAGRRSQVEGAQVADLSRKSQVERGKRRDVVMSRREIRREGSVAKQRDSESSSGQSRMLREVI